MYKLLPKRCQPGPKATDAKHILAVSTHGKYCLYISAPVNKLPDVSKYANEEIRLLCMDGRIITLWKPSMKSHIEAEQDDSTNRSTLQYFYNNGGLAAFSDKVEVLVLCVPTDPSWSLIAFDLTAKNIALSMRPIPYSTSLNGTNLTSLCFSKTQKTQLYLLDTLGNTTALSLSNKASSIDATSNRPTLVSGVLSVGDNFHVYSSSLGHSGDTPREQNRLTSTQTSAKFYVIDVRSLESTHLNTLSLGWLKHVRSIMSEDVIIDCDAVFQAMNTRWISNSDDWSEVFKNAQSTINGVTDALKEKQTLDTPRLVENPKSEVSTSIKFNRSISKAFFHTLIWSASQSIDPQPTWTQTMLIEVRSLGVSGASKTRKFTLGTVGIMTKSYLTSTFHEETSLLAFLSSSNHTGRSAASTVIRPSTLCFWALPKSPFIDLTKDDKHTHHNSSKYTLRKYPASPSKRTHTKPPKPIHAFRNSSSRLMLATSTVSPSAVTCSGSTCERAPSTKGYLSRALISRRPCH
jgi:hypothetical protein